MILPRCIFGFVKLKATLNKPESLAFYNSGYLYNIAKIFYKLKYLKIKNFNLLIIISNK